MVAQLQWRKELTIKEAFHSIRGKPAEGDREHRYKTTPEIKNKRWRRFQDLQRVRELALLPRWKSKKTWSDESEII